MGILSGASAREPETGAARKRAATASNTGTRQGRPVDEAATEKRLTIMLIGNKFKRVNRLVDAWLQD
jgi:hypothetical protein